MPATLFLQSEIEDPYKLYETMLDENPVYWDEINQLWAIYSYENCKAILGNSSAHIPAIGETNGEKLNEYALLITGRLARLNNGVHHEIARQATMLLFGRMKTIASGTIIEKLLQDSNNKDEIDWVNLICKKLPVMVVLKSFDFNEEDADFISGKIEQLVKIMLPVKTHEQAKHINEFSMEIYCITERHLLNTNMFKTVIETLSEKYELNTQDIISLCVSNLIGLFIQGYDAGRGVLSNSLLQVLNKNNLVKPGSGGKEYLRKLVIETLRFDPPIHNTRRVATDDIILCNSEIKKGEIIFVVLAAANRDPSKFDDPNTYNIERTNNDEYLTFGFGGHACVAKYFSVALATETLSWLLDRHKKIRLLEKHILYEPFINARLPKTILISLS